MNAPKDPADGQVEETVLDASDVEFVDEDIEGEVEEISIEVDEEGRIWVEGEGWELQLSPEEARELGQALLDAAADAEEPTE